MAEPQTPPSASAEGPRPFTHLRELFGALAGYLHARFALAGLESKEAVLHYLKIVALVVVALFLIVFGYLFLCVSVAVLLAQWIGASWGWMLLGIAVLHLILAAVGALLAKSLLSQPMFTTTLQELRKDKEWLTAPR